MKRLIKEYTSAAFLLSGVCVSAVGITAMDSKVIWIPIAILVAGVISMVIGMSMLLELIDDNKVKVRYDKRYIYIDDVKIPRKASDFDELEAVIKEARDD